MLFRHCNAPGNFQQSMDVVLLSSKSKLALICLDNTAIFCNTSQEHIKYACKASKLLNRLEVAPTFKSTNIFNNTVDLIGYDICSGRVEVAYPVTTKWCEVQLPTSITKLRAFLGYWVVSKWFVPSSAWVASPLAQRSLKAKPAPFLPALQWSLIEGEAIYAST